MTLPSVFSVYKITNTINGMLYIGSTRWSPAARWSQHKASAKMGISHPLYNAMREYGIGNFTFEVVKKHRGKNGEKSMLSSENALILSLNTLVPNGYNCLRAVKKIVKPLVYPGWYRVKDALKVLSTNSQREIKNTQLVRLAKAHKIRTKRISPRIILYHKKDIDAFTVSSKRGRPKKQNSIPAVKRKPGRPKKLSPHNVTQSSLWQDYSKQDADEIQSLRPPKKRNPIPVS